MMKGMMFIGGLVMLIRSWNMDHDISNSIAATFYGMMIGALLHFVIQIFMAPHLEPEDQNEE